MVKVGEGVLFLARPKILNLVVVNSSVTLHINRCHSDTSAKMNMCEMKTVMHIMVVFNVPSTARSFRDGAPIYCPLQRT